MRIDILTSGRFHVANLAIELERLGHDIVFHSIVPPRRLVDRGLSRQSQRCHLGALAHLVAAQRLGQLPDSVREEIERRILLTLDERYAREARTVDVFVGMSGLSVSAVGEASRRGALTVLERGSMHILEQRSILESLHSARGVRDFAVQRELAGYRSTHYISVPSIHAQESFVRNGVAVEKMLRNPYGVDLDEFPATTLAEDAYDVINVGTWGSQKGSDVLASAVLDILGLRLLHVGGRGDLPFPDHENFTHVEPVPQACLTTHYARARVFALPSNQEGLALVQAQALASGLPIVGSTSSGSTDLAELIGLGAPSIQSVEPGDAVALANAIVIALDVSSSAARDRPRDVLGSRRQLLSWREYGLRYEARLRSLIG